MKKNYITPDILKIEVLDDYLIKLFFDNNEEKIYDMKKLIKTNTIYKNLKYKEYFKKVKPRGETIEWEDGEDICPESLYYDSKLINK